ncbi:cyclopropane-fatty-acyl-phospholipid synthase [Thiothrix eikelboomii]|uniref:Cyclopropane-fatty-acyl-phospholipid synthase n=1 Tax=Thiothrix eikelboomii TaxID=92487 RepID=A0A1T4XC29_9GAMM|nr:cyclopropane-fatty-acyl-phospholipid synthase family protein [Thiothrix eikelboomii]SKA87076.1 cyclopropane-fatty-acyl-phospholipid synthase [Thiothrix eikelboomii]
MTTLSTVKLPKTRSFGSVAFAKALFLRLLAKLDRGYLTIQDSDAFYAFGDPQDTLQAHLTVHDQRGYARVLWGGGTIAAGECYVEGLWDTPDLTKVIQVFVRNQSLLDQLDHGFSWLSQIGYRLAHALRSNSKAGSKKNIRAHYDLSNEFYQLFLDETMLYSSAVFPSPTSSLYLAQLHKLQLICEGLQLKAGDHLLEIGTGWGALAVYAAEHYQVQVTTTTISEAQYRYVQQLIRDQGLEQQITLLKQDYRELTGQYDKLVSIEMIEAVGYEHLPQFFKQCNQLLKPEGRLFLQAITMSDQRYARYRKQADFIQSYIFPGGFLPSMTVLNEHFTRYTDMKISGLSDFGLDYALTLEHWSLRLQAKQDQLTGLGLDHQFYRLWQFYLHYCMGGFKERLISAIHLTADKPGYHDQTTSVDYTD